MCSNSRRAQLAVHCCRLRRLAQAAELSALLNQQTQQQLQLKDAFAKSDQVRAAMLDSV